MAYRYIQGSIISVISIGSEMEIFGNVSGCFRTPAKPKNFSSFPSQLPSMLFSLE